MAFDITTAKPISTNFDIKTAKPVSIKDNFQEVPKLTEIEQPKEESNIGDKTLGFARSLTQGYTAGQAPHLAGVTNELANLPKKYKSVSSIDDIKRFYKDLGKDYVKGREQFKTEYKDFADKNKALSTIGEILGGIGTGSGLLKGLTVSSKPVLNLMAKGGLEGAGFGGLYGASNTEGKAVDLQKAAIGSLIGAAGGAAIPAAISGARGTLGLFNKGVRRFSDILRPIKPVRELPKTQKVEEVVEQIKPITETPKVETVQQVAKENVPLKAEENVIKADFPQVKEEQTIQELAKEKVPFKVIENTDEATVPFLNKEGKILEGDVISYINQKGVPDKAIKFIRDNPAVAQEIRERQGDFSMRFGVYGNKALDSISEIVPKIKAAESNAYKQAFKNAGIENGEQYFVQNQPDTINKISTAIMKYSNRVPDKETAETFGFTYGFENFYKKFLNNQLIKNGGIKFGNLKEFTNNLNYKMEQIAKDVTKGKNAPEYKLLQEIQAALSELKHNDVVIGPPTRKFSNLQKAMKRLEEEGGFKLDAKGKKQNAAKIFQSVRDRAGDTQEDALDEFVKEISKFDDTIDLANVKNNIQIAQTSYGLRDATRDNKLSAGIEQLQKTKPTNILMNVAKRFVDEKDLNNDEFALLIANRLAEGKITPKDLKTFQRMKNSRFSDYELNRIIQRNRILGTKAAGLKGKIISSLGGK